jgi:hypothetical protein
MMMAGGSDEPVDQHNREWHRSDLGNSTVHGCRCHPVLPCGIKQRDVQLDSRTLKDIGVEPGSITWTQ